MIARPNEEIEWCEGKVLKLQLIEKNNNFICHLQRPSVKVIAVCEGQ